MLGLSQWPKLEARPNVQLSVEDVYSFRMGELHIVLEDLEGKEELNSSLGPVTRIYLEAEDWAWAAPGAAPALGTRTPR